MKRSDVKDRYRIKFLFVLFPLIMLYVPMHAQKIPDIFWNAPLAESARYFNIESNVPVKSVFRDQDFLRTTNLDGTETYSRLKSKWIKGDDVYIVIESVQGKDILISAKWQLTYRTDKKDVVISSIEISTPDSDGPILYTLYDAMISGNDYKNYMMLIIKMFGLYFDPEKIGANSQKVDN